MNIFVLNYVYDLYLSHPFSLFDLLAGGYLMMCITYKHYMCGFVAEYGTRFHNIHICFDNMMGI